MSKAACLFAEPFWLAQDAFGNSGDEMPPDPEHHPPADLESAHGERRAP